MHKAQISTSVLRDRVGEVIFERGRRYAAEGRVHLRSHDEVSAQAEVAGSEVYEVEIEAAERGLAADCTCPFADDGLFCKHMVATVLCWLEGESELGVTGSARRPTQADDGFRRAMGTDPVVPAGDSDLFGADVDVESEDPAEDAPAEQRLRTFLAGQDTAYLVDLLLEAGRRDPMFAARLAVEAGDSGRSALDEVPLRNALVDAFSVEDLVDFDEAFDYFWGIDEVLGEIDDLTDAGFAPSAARLALFALGLLDEFGDMVDDSGGGLVDAIARIEEIHLRASRNHDVDVDALADTLVHHAVTSDYEVFYDAPAQYAEILGQQGLQRFRDLLEQRGRALPKGLDRFDDDRFAVTFLRERVAEVLGGADMLLEVLQEDATSASDHLRIAHLLYREDRPQEALDRIDLGLEADGPNQRLNELAATIHREAGRGDLAGQLLWENFTNQPGDLTYRSLKNGTGEDFARWREQAIAMLQEPRRGAHRTDFSTVVSALLWEGDVDRAWQAAHDGGCGQGLWLRLARDRAQGHPADALPILLQEADRSIEGAQRTAYHQAASLLTEARSLAERSGVLKEFDRHVRDVRERNRRRPALQDEFTRASLP
ncbi:MAG: SWIM zinc finger family protein [Brachybacterium sp.]|uniref:SWIM zinc finger family protein n=1 Tax=Brachybacterium sp. TaxID=1891286 RepID=UPI002647B714|nr:DUF6880 family protein [Brachybacterium sp.]MDN5685360.1 SWIM zinc finger family protein [Brachybacterium sp.]